MSLRIGGTKYPDQDGYMPRYGEGYQVGYQRREPSFPYQVVILSNYQVEFIMK